MGGGVIARSSQEDANHGGIRCANPRDVTGPVQRPPFGPPDLRKTLRSIALVLSLAVLGGSLASCGAFQTGNARANKPIPSALQSKLSAMGSSAAAPMMIRIFKESSELEVWKQVNGGGYKLLKTYEVCAWSGELGPKFREGDRQAPEGFYTITPGLMNPNSQYYLAFNTGFPNKFDRVHGRTGSDLMVHGDCSSRGCYAMTDESIAEIYALARETFKGGNASFQLQIYPFRMSVANLAKHADSPHMSFWKDIKEGHDRFELTKRPPSWDVCNKEYVFDVPAGMALDAAGTCPVQVAQLPPELAAKTAADEAALNREIAARAGRAAQAAAQAERQAQLDAEAKARGEAIGSFIGGLFDGQPAEAPAAQPDAPAPTPAPRPRA